MKFDFEIKHRPGLYHQAADLISKLLKEDDSSMHDEKAVEDEIPTYYIMGQESVLCSTIYVDCSTAQTMTAPKVIFDSQKSDKYCQHILSLVKGSGSLFSINKNGLMGQMHF